ncbi:MAG: hypothetical protein Q8O67_04985 [Deltaproteobacteria bacterium]|nr:hypothetical protein [Deltaproteobacteria bacterium]
MTRSSLLVCMAAVGVAACGAEPLRNNGDIDPADFSGPITGARDGHLLGDIGPAEGINAPATRINSWDDGTYLAVDAVAQLEDRAAMLFLSASNAAELFVPGTEQTFTFNDYYDYEVGQPQIGLLGCVGQAIDVYDQYDAAADEIDVIVQPATDGGPGDIDVEIVGRWFIEAPTDGAVSTREARGSFVLERE